MPAFVLDCFEKTEIVAGNTKDLLMLKKSNKSSAFKASTNNTLNAAGCKSPLALHSKKSPFKLKSNISSSTSPINNSSKQLTTMHKLKTTPNSAINAKKSLDLNKSSTAATTTATAFNKLANNNVTEHMVSKNPTTSAPFSINNVSNLNNNQQPQTVAAFYNASPSVVNAKSNNLLRPLKINKTANNTTATTILKATAINAANKTNNSRNTLNDLSMAMTPIKKVNFIIPEECERIKEHLSSPQKSSKATQDNVEQHVEEHVDKLKKSLKYLKEAKHDDQHNSNLVLKQHNKTSFDLSNNVYKQEYGENHLTTRHEQEHYYHHKHGYLNKNIVYNGTFPIDMPLTTLLNNYDPEANCSNGDLINYEVYASSSNEDDDDDDDDDEDNEDDNDDYDYEEEENDNNNTKYLLTQDLESYKHSPRHRHHHHTLASANGILEAKPTSTATLDSCSAIEKQKSPQVWSIKELINDPSIPLNYKKMCNEVEQSLQQFEQYIDAKANNDNKAYKLPKPPVLRTFNIDDPIDLKKNI